MLWFFSLLPVANKYSSVQFGVRKIVNSYWTTVPLHLLYHLIIITALWSGCHHLPFTDDSVERSRNFSKVSLLVSGKARTWTSLSDPKRWAYPTSLYCLLFLWFLSLPASNYSDSLVNVIKSSLSFHIRGELLVKEPRLFGSVYHKNHTCIQHGSLKSSSTFISSWKILTVFRLNWYQPPMSVGTIEIRNNMFLWILY